MLHQFALWLVLIVGQESCITPHTGKSLFPSEFFAEQIVDVKWRDGSMVLLAQVEQNPSATKSVFLDARSLAPMVLLATEGNQFKVDWKIPTTETTSAQTVRLFESMRRFFLFSTQDASQYSVENAVFRFSSTLVGEGTCRIPKEIIMEVADPAMHVRITTLRTSCEGSKDAG